MLKSISRRGIAELREVNRAVFGCFLSADYADDRYEQERLLNIHKHRFLVMLKEVSERVTMLESIYENIMDYAQLRWRIEDHSSYTLCAVELREIETAIDLLFVQLGYKLPLDTTRLTNAIDDLETIYQAVLKVAVQESLVILCFISSLYGLRDKLSEIYL